MLKKNPQRIEVSLPLKNTDLKMILIPKRERGFFYRFFSIAIRYLNIFNAKNIGESSLYVNAIKRGKIRTQILT